MTSPSPGDRVTPERPTKSDSRIFVSYRRSDGTYAVGWLAERLRALDSVTGVQSTFHDSVLRAGTDLADALDTELASCDVVLAVITPGWRGERPDGTARIMDPDDWIVREIAAGLRHGTTIMPILVDGAEHPLPSQMHESIAGLNRLLAKPFRDQADLEPIVEQVAARIDELDQERARLDGLVEPVKVPKLPRPGLLAAVATVIGALLAVLMWWSGSHGIVGPEAGCGSTPGCVQDTGGYRVLEFWMPALGLFSGVLAAVGGALAWRLHRIAHIDWRAMVGIAGGMGGSLALITIASRSGHAALADVPGLPDPWLRFGANAVTSFVGASGLIVGLLAPVYSTPRAEQHLLGERVAYLAIARDAERWAAAFLSALFAVITGAGAFLLLAFDQADVGTDPGPLPNIVFALVFSMMLIIVHRWSITRLTDVRAAIDTELADLPPRFRANAEPRLEAGAFDEGGWGFRAFLALPVLVALGSAALLALA